MTESLSNVAPCGRSKGEEGDYVKTPIDVGVF